MLIQNQTSHDARFRTEILDMQEGPGASRALDYVPVGSARRGAGGWLAPVRPSSFRVTAGSQRAVPLVVDVPNGTRPGGYYAAMLFTASDPDPGSQVPIDVRQPVPVYVTVRGEMERSVAIRAVPEDRWRWRGGAITWRVELRNTGDLHESIAGTLRTSALLGGQASTPLRPAVLLPGERRTQRVSVQIRDAPDILKARGLVDGGDDGPHASGDFARVVILPWWLLLLASVAAGIVAWRVQRRRSGDVQTDDQDEIFGDESR